MFFSSDVAVIFAPGHHDPGLAPDRRRPLRGREEAPQPRQQPQHRHQGASPRGFSTCIESSHVTCSQRLRKLLGITWFYIMLAFVYMDLY